LPQAGSTPAALLARAAASRSPLPHHHPIYLGRELGRVRLATTTTTDDRTTDDDDDDDDVRRANERTSERANERNERKRAK
jgi:hypothetical protein